MKPLKSQIILLLLFFFGPIWGQTSFVDYHLKLLPVADMLPNSTVKRIFQDRDGFMWFATESGLCRYDGYKTQTVQIPESASYSFISNNIQCLSQDAQGRIWAGTVEGLMIVDRHCNLINLFRNNPIQQCRITSLFADGRYMWVGTDNGLYRYDLEQNVFKSYLHQHGSNQTLPKGSVSAIYKDRDNRIWLALWNGGLCWLDSQKSVFHVLPPIGKNNNPFNIYQDQDGIYWISTWRDGLLKMTFDSMKQEYHYQIFNVASLVPQAGTRNVVYNVVEDCHHHLWLVTPRGIVRMKDKEKGVFEYVPTQGVFPRTSNFLHSVYKDKDGNIWVGATNDGVYYISFDEQMFHYNILEDPKQQLGYTIVNDIQFIKGQLWFGLTNGGIHIVDPNTNFRSVYWSQNTTSISKILYIPFADEIWTFGDNISRVSKSDNKRLITQPCFLPQQDSKKPFSGNNTNDAVVDAKRRIWIASRFGIYLYPWGEKVRCITPYFKEVTKLLVENDSTVWGLSSARGILKITERDHQFHVQGYHASNGKLNARDAKSILRDADGVLWVGTDNGLFSYNPKRDIFENQNGAYALLEKDITNIQQDSHHNLWLTSNNKIIKIDRVHHISTTYSSDNNIMVSTFRNHSSLSVGDSLLLFGGSEGVCYFKPKDEKRVLHPHNLMITDIQVFNKSIFDQANRDLGIYKKDTLILNYNHNNIGIEFSALDYNSQGNNKYAFKLNGVDQDWVYVDSKRRYVNYNDLKAGKYLFQVKSSDKNGEWMDHITNLYIEVIPAPYFTPWAYSIYILLILLILGSATYLTVNRIRLRNRLMISNIEKKKTEELTQTKLRYFTNISHELLTPLTIISCLADEIGLQHPEIKSEYATMKANINRLKRLLQQVLDFRKTESANMKLKVGYADLVKVVKEICRLNFAPLIEEKAISFQVNASEEPIWGWFDADKIDKILFNLLSNAFKYTPQGGTIEVTVNSFFLEEIHWVELSVRDTGRGIDPKFLPFIFDRFVGDVHDKKIESNGIGLSLAKDLTQLHMGTLEVASELGKGSIFTVKIPISESVFKDVLKFEINDSMVVSNQPDSRAVVSDQNSMLPDKRSILFVDDNQDLLSTLARFFSRRFQVFTAKNGIEALACLRDNEIQLIISDVMMPEMDGLELCAQVKNNIETSHIPVILLTAKSQLEDRIECYKADANAYISKPFDLSLLEVRIDNLLNARMEKNKQYKKEVHLNLQDLDYNSLDQEYLNKAIQIVELHLGNFDFTPETLIKEMNTTKSTLYRKLKSLTGLSTSEFIKNIRLKRACEMLEKDAGNISDIAYNVGFNDPKYFSTCFRTEFGVSPREYVRNLKTDTASVSQ